MRKFRKKRPREIRPFHTYLRCEQWRVDARDVVSAVTVTVARSRTTSASYVTGKPFAGVPAPHEGTLLLVVCVCAWRVCRVVPVGSTQREHRCAHYTTVCVRRREGEAMTVDVLLWAEEAWRAGDGVADQPRRHGVACLGTVTAREDPTRANRAH